MKEEKPVLTSQWETDLQGDAVEDVVAVEVVGGESGVRKGLTPEESGILTDTAAMTSPARKPSRSEEEPDPTTGATPRKKAVNRTNRPHLKVLRKGRSLLHLSTLKTRRTRWRR